MKSGYLEGEPDDTNYLGKNLKAAKRIDRLAAWVISAAGIAVIAAVIGILVIILRVVLPLFESPKAELNARHDLAKAVSLHGETLAIGIDDLQKLAFTVHRDGTVVLTKLDKDKFESTVDLREIAHRNENLVGVEAHSQGYLSLQWQDGTSSLARLRFEPRYADDGTKHEDVQCQLIGEFAAFEKPLQRVWLRNGKNGELTRVALREDGQLLYERIEKSAGLFGGGEPVHTTISIDPDEAKKFGALAVSQNGDQLVVAAAGSPTILVYDWGENQNLTKDHFFYDRSASITAVNYVFGDQSLVLGDSDGNLSSWQSYRGRWVKFHDLVGHSAGIQRLEHSWRDKTIVSQDAVGLIRVQYLTNERQLFSFHEPSPFKLFAYANRNDGLLALNSKGELIHWLLDAAHPEANFKAMFRKIWYESYEKAAFVWQSTGGSDEFESKLSLVPLIFGTLKGTFYALLLALPLSLLGAIYLSQFASDGVKKVAKPAIELMASLPSVVVGFMAALWFAPLVGQHLLAVLIFFLAFPIVMTGFLVIWPFIAGRSWAKSLGRGYEFTMFVPTFLATCGLAWLITDYVELKIFGGPLPQWLFDHLGIHFDLRNSVVIAFALGFAVIPIILSIAEDSLSNVPKTIVASSLALGASRWQTVWRLVLPSASPGIFAATMLGIGRAIGETMIVLMATGNTPIIDLSPFNGMRTLSANIAVEVSEAPVGGTLYRTLFLCAVILFCMTFFLNSVAEAVRHKLRKKYGKF